MLLVWAAMPLAYAVLRVWVFLFGLGLLALDVAAPALSWESAAEAQLERSGVLFHSVVRLATLSYLLPFRWGIDTPVFHARVTLAATVLARTMFVGIEMALGAWGAKHWTLWPLLAALVLTETTAIGLLFWRRNP